MNSSYPGLPILEGGHYILVLSVSSNLNVRFGRFQEGAPVSFPAGTCVYLGSALTQRNQPALPQRVLRHCTRSNGQPAHVIRDSLLEYFNQPGVCGSPVKVPTGKKLHWHIDYLVDYPEVSIRQVLLFPGEKPVEKQLGAWINAHPLSSQIVKGLGARDIPGNTHLLRWLGNPEDLVKEILHSIGQNEPLRYLADIGIVILPSPF